MDNVTLSLKNFTKSTGLILQLSFKHLVFELVFKCFSFMCVFNHISFGFMLEFCMEKRKSHIFILLKYY